MTSPAAPDDRQPAYASSSKLLRRLLSEQVRPHLGSLTLALAAMIVVAAMTAATAWLLKPAIDQVFTQRDPYWTLMIPIAVVIVVVIKGVATYFEGTLMTSFGEKVIADTQIRLYSHLIHADLAWLHDMHSGRLISSFLFDATLLREAVTKALTGMVKDSLSLLFLTGVMFSMNWQFALIVCVIFPFVGLSTRRLGKKARKNSARGQQETGKLTTILSETFEGARMVKAYGMEQREIDRARASVDTRLSHLMKVVRARAAASPTTEALGGIAVAVIIYIGGTSETLTLGTLTAFIYAALTAYQPLKSLANFQTAMQEGLAAADRIFTILDIKPTIAEHDGARPLQIAGGEIRLDNVSFRYAADKTALQDISLLVPPGRKAALVGASGAGKSTLLNLVPRFYDASAGRVLIDGQDVRDVTLASLRRNVALVSQELTLFDDTIRANIAYGRPEASQAEIESAARHAAAHDFISALPQGYDTVVGENGVKLSGGQRQRIAIARAMLRDAPILLLDEATSALDTESERLIQTALGELMRGRTTLVIAHRLSTVIDADVIFVLDHGRLVEQGSHAELLARNGVYARLYATQFAVEVQA
ncbi:MAG: lipid A export permease/ATP-binding protein MsbA [Ferrovibrio sp.]|uniref:lipid A export permease/ATP-binding protein MsbA n=1 Tax=Ferrovibrio sp. TaxID=1917215 RepID=UPI002613ABB0|nr:lipid A export permease/ATP-binding protein MsbA [Ferrovibrio sp.]MCW0232846.1 lipid A export permease/ATP-binding protein MsbA [Ferrovibrio sp.]